MNEKPTIVRLTHEFRRRAKRSRITDRELAIILDTLKRSPETGVVIPGTDGARKIRFAGRGKGKSGGYRVITCFVSSGSADSIYLFDIYAKGDRVDLTQAERNALRVIIRQIRAAHEAS